MAKQYTLTTELTKLDETKGIIYNKSRDTIELYSTDTAEIGTGLPVLSGQRQPFSGTVYARAIDSEGTEAIINVVDFNVSAGGGEDSAKVTVIKTQKAHIVPSTGTQTVKPDTGYYFDQVDVDAATASTVTLPSGVTELMTVSEVDALFA